MSTKSDFTSEAWTKLLQSPAWASLVVVAASPSGPLGVVKEMFAAGKVLAEAKTGGGPNGLVNALVGDLATREGRQVGHPADLRATSPEELRRIALDRLREVAALADGKAGPDADGFKRWLLSLAGRVAEASKEGGFLGIGGTRVSEAETTALRDIGQALGVAA